MSSLEQIIDYGDYLATAKDANGNVWLVVKGNKDPDAVDPSGRPVLYPLLLFEYRGIINEGPPTFGNFVGDIRFNGQDGTQYAGIFGYSRNGYALTFDCDANQFGCSFTANNNQDRLNVIYPSLTGQTYTGQDGKTYNQIDSTNPFTLYDGAFRMLMNNRRLGARVTASNLTSVGVLHTLTTGKKSVSFVRANEQFMQLNYPSFKLTFASTGCTAVAVVRFTGSPGNNERVFEAATGSNGQDSFCVYRYGTTDKLACTIYNGSTQIGLIQNVGTIIQDAWTTIVSVYENSTNTLKLYQDGALLDSVVCSAAATDKTMSYDYSYLGKSTFASDSYSNYNVAALFVNNSVMSSTDVSYINASNYEGLIYKGGSQLSDSTVGSYFPIFYTGSLVNKNVGESLFSWNGTAYQVNAANQPTVAQTTYLTSDSTGLTVNGNITGSVGTLTSLSVTGNVSAGGTITVNSTNNRVGINNATPAYTLDIAGDINLSSGSQFRIAGVPAGITPTVTTTQNVFTATQGGSPGTAPTKPTTTISDYITVKDDGSGLCFCQFNFCYDSPAGSSAGLGVYLFQLPTGYSFDLTTHRQVPSGITSGTTTVQRSGTAIPGSHGFSVGTADYRLLMMVFDSTRFCIFAGTNVGYISHATGNFATGFGSTVLSHNGAFQFKKA